MTITTIHPEHFATSTEREVYSRTRKAVTIANTALPRLGDDARNFATTDWDDLAVSTHTRNPSPLTRAAVTAILDTEREDFATNPEGDGNECRTFNQTRKAIRVARVLWEVGVEDARTLTPWQWRTTRILAKVTPLSAITKAAVVAVLDVWAEA